MIRNNPFLNITVVPLRLLTQLGLMAILISGQLQAGNPPKQLIGVIDHFMNMDSTSLEISQVIDWRFSSKYDSVSLQMDIKGGRNFRLTLADFGLEIFVNEREMITLNHVRSQILFEKSSPDALIKQLFVGGDLDDARFKREKSLDDGSRQLDFKFVGDFSDWESLSVILDEKDDLKRMTLIDYDGNKYLIAMVYQTKFNDFMLPDVKQDYLHYQVADLRE